VQFLILRQAIEHGTEAGQSDKSMPAVLRKTKYEVQAWNKEVQVDKTKTVLARRNAVADCI
jgi:hypothetical protein